MTSLCLGQWCGLFLFLFFFPIKIHDLCKIKVLDRRFPLFFVESFLCSLKFYCFIWQGVSSDGGTYTQQIKAFYVVSGWCYNNIRTCQFILYVGQNRHFISYDTAAVNVRYTMWQYMQQCNNVGDCLDIKCTVCTGPMVRLADILCDTIIFLL